MFRELKPAVLAASSRVDYNIAVPEGEDCVYYFLVNYFQGFGFCIDQGFNLVSEMLYKGFPCGFTPFVWTLAWPSAICMISARGIR